MENKKNGGLCKASLVLGVIAIVFALLPLLNVWFVFLSTINYLLVPAGVVCGVVALLQGQNTVKAIIGIVLSALAILCPFVLAEYYVSSAADSIGDMLDVMSDF